MKYSLPTGSITKTNLYAAEINIQLHIIVVYPHHFNVSKSVLYIEKLTTGQQITFNKKVISRKRSLVTVNPTLNPGQVMKKIDNTRLPTVKVLTMMKI